MKPSIFLNELIDLKHMETLEKMPFEAQHKIFKKTGRNSRLKDPDKRRAGEIRQHHDGHVGQLCSI